MCGDGQSEVEEAEFLPGGKHRAEKPGVCLVVQWCVSLREDGPSLDVFSPAANDSVLVYLQAFLKQKRTSLNC